MDKLFRVKRIQLFMTLFELVLTILSKSYSRYIFSTIPMIAFFLNLFIYTRETERVGRKDGQQR